jgi:hypothetical protein
MDERFQQQKTLRKAPPQVPMPKPKRSKLVQPKTVTLKPSQIPKVNLPMDIAQRNKSKRKKQVLQQHKPIVPPRQLRFDEFPDSIPGTSNLPSSFAMHAPLPPDDEDDDL